MDKELLMTIRKNDPITIKKEWQDAGDDTFSWIAVSDEEKGRVDIMVIDSVLNFPSIQTVKVDMLEGH